MWRYTAIFSELKKRYKATAVDVFVGQLSASGIGFLDFFKLNELSFKTRLV